MGDKRSDELHVLLHWPTFCHHPIDDSLLAVRQSVSAWPAVTLTPFQVGKSAHYSYGWVTAKLHHVVYVAPNQTYVRP